MKTAWTLCALSLASAVLIVPIPFTSYAADLECAPTASATGGNTGKNVKPSDANYADSVPSGPAADYEAAKELQPALDEAVVNAREKVSDAKAASPPDPKLPDLETSLAKAAKAADDNSAKVRQFEVPASKSFFYDVMSDSNGIAFHRLQVFAWTMTFWFIFIVALFHQITLMNFDPTQLGLMGISGATYLGFKLQEQAKQPGTGPASD